MRHSGLTISYWIVTLFVVGIGVSAGYFFTDDKSGDVVSGVFLTFLSLAIAFMSRLLASEGGNGKVVTSHPGRGDHDLIFGATYQVVSCTRWQNRGAEGPSGYAVVLEDADGALWSCVLPKEPPAHFVYTRGEQRFVLYTPPTPTTPVIQALL